MQANATQKGLTGVTIVNRAQIEYDWDALAQPYAVLNRLAVMTQDPEQSNQVSFEVREVGRIRARFVARNRLDSFPPFRV